MTEKILRHFTSISLLFLSCLATQSALAQTKEAGAGNTTKEVYTGSVIRVGGRGSGASSTFNLTITGQTSDEDLQRLLNVLAEEKQDGLLKVAAKEKKGFFSIGGQVGRDLNFVRETETEEGEKKIVIVFERWLKFAEVRYGYRSEDYPFAMIELFIDSKGKGEGTFIEAAKIRWVTDKKTGKPHVEIENFGTYPAKLMGVMRRSK
jgi:hypothetical protein